MKKTLLLFTMAILLVSCTTKLPQKVDYPHYAFRNIASQELISVERTDTATVLSFKSFYLSHQWIKVSPEAYLTDGKTKYALKGTVGITPGELLYMDDDGHAEYKLLFEPIPKSAKDISYIESEDASRAFNFYHIDLSGKAPVTLKTSQKLPDSLPEVTLKSGETTIEIKLPCSLVGLPQVPVTIYVNSFFPPDQKEYNGLLDDNGKASFNIYLYGPAQAILMVGDELSYGYILLDPGETVSVTVDGSGRQLTIDNLFLGEEIPQDFICTGKYAAVNMLDQSETMNYTFDIYNGSFALNAETMSEYAAIVKNTYDVKLSALAAADTLSPFLKEYLKGFIAAEATQAICNAGTIRKVQYRMAHHGDVSGYEKGAFTIEDVSFLKDMNLNDSRVLLFGTDCILGPELSPLVFPDGKGFQSDFSEALLIARKAYLDGTLDSADMEALDNMDSPIYKESIESLLKAHEAASEAMPDYVKEVPDVPAGKLLDAILSQYKDQVVLIDIWATWCSPCRYAHRQLEPMKDNRYKDVTFVYFTSTTSPLPDWRQMIGDIRGDHYYFTEEQLKTIFTQIESNAYPTYLIVGRDGTIQGKVIGFGESLYQQLDAALASKKTEGRLST